MSDDVLHHFQEAATKLIDEKGSVKALCAALAYISGFSEVPSRSLLTSEQVKVEIHMQVHIYTVD